jgi:hypothetical protein
VFIEFIFIFFLIYSTHLGGYLEMLKQLKKIQEEFGSPKGGSSKNDVCGEVLRALQPNALWIFTRICLIRIRVDEWRRSMISEMGVSLNRFLGQLPDAMVEAHALQPFRQFDRNIHLFPPVCIKEAAGIAAELEEFLLEFFGRPGQ